MELVHKIIAEFEKYEESRFVLGFLGAWVAYAIWGLVSKPEEVAPEQLKRQDRQRRVLAIGIAIVVGTFKIPHPSVNFLLGFVFGATVEPVCHVICRACIAVDRLMRALWYMARKLGGEILRRLPEVIRIVSEHNERQAQEKALEELFQGLSERRAVPETPKS